MADYTLPTANQGNWEPGVDVGITGGFDQYRPGGASARVIGVNGVDHLDVTLAPYNADKTGVVSSTAAIAAALDDATSGMVVYLPEGLYRFSKLNIPDTTDNITMRGDGPDKTIMYTVGQAESMYVGTGGTALSDKETEAASATRLKGTDTMTVTSTAALSVGDLVVLKAEKDIDDTRIGSGITPVTSWAGTDAYSCTHRITAINSATEFEFDPPLPLDFYGAFDILNQEFTPHNKLTKFGIEDLRVTGRESTDLANPIVMIRNVECWLYNVKVDTAKNKFVQQIYCHRNEIRKCTIGGRTTSGSYGSGILNQQSSSCLIVDNILYDVSPLCSFWVSVANCVLAYNYFQDNGSGNGLLWHNTHCSLTLVEGNVATDYKCDGFFGTNSHNTIYRNLLHGTIDGVARVDAQAALRRGSYYFANVGNVMGTDGVRAGSFSYGLPNIGNADTNGETCTPLAGTFWMDWKKTGTIKTRLSDTEAIITVSDVGDLGGAYGTHVNGPFFYWSGEARYKVPESLIDGLDITYGVGEYTGGSVWPAETTALEVWGGQPGFQERDLSVEASTVNVHNYLALTGGTGSVDEPTVDTLPASMAYTAEPSWWGDDGFAGAWPPVDPDNPTSSQLIIPAGARYFEVASGNPYDLTASAL